MPEQVGRRVYPNADGSMPPMYAGDFGCFGGVWWGFAPGAHLAAFDDHEVNEHEDGTITVAPSIVATPDVPLVLGDDWHGYLERGVWRW